MEGDRFLTSAEVAQRMDISLRTLWRMVRDGRLPQPIRYSRRLVRFRLSDLKRYEENPTRL